MENQQDIRTKIHVLFQELNASEQQELLVVLQKEIAQVKPKNLKNLLQERGISKGMYGNVEGFLNNEENSGVRKESAFKNKSLADAVKAMREKRKKS